MVDLTFVRVMLNWVLPKGTDVGLCLCFIKTSDTLTLSFWPWNEVTVSVIHSLPNFRILSLSVKKNNNLENKRVFSQLLPTDNGSQSVPNADQPAQE